jgi:hypothetical protein
MSGASIQISSDVLDQGHYEVTVLQNGVDTASLDIREWTTGADTSGAPSTDNSYDLDTIRANTPYQIHCITSAMWQRPQITMKLSAPGQKPSLTITVDHAWFAPGPILLPLSADDHDEVVAFLKQAAFPVG